MRTARLERAMIAALTAYALIVQVLLAAIGNGAALAHALDGPGALCVTVGAGAAPNGDGVPPQDLCCVAPVLVGTLAPVLVVGPPAPTFRLALAPSTSIRGAAPVPAVARARAPPGIG